MLKIFRNLEKREIVLAMLCLFLVISWFRYGKLLVYGEDINFFLNPEIALKQSVYLWNDKIVPGYLTPQGLPTVPTIFSVFILSKTGISLLNVQRVYTLFLLIMSSISIYRLSLSFSKNRNSAFASSLFYLANPYFMSSVLVGVSSTLFVFYTLTPAMFYFYKRFLETNKMRYTIFMGFFSLFHSYALLGGALLFTFLLFMLTYFVFELFLNYRKKRIVKLIKNTTIFVLIWLVFSVWWVIPYMFSATGHYNDLIDSDKNFASLKSSARYTKIGDVVRLINPHRIYATQEFGEEYSSDLFETISIFTPILAFLSIIKIKDKKVAYFLFTSLLFVFLSKGLNWPLQGWFEWLFKNVPFFGLYRSPYNKFGLILPITYSMLFGKTESILKGKLNKLFWISLFAIVFIYSAPVWTAEGFDEYSISVPEYYDKFNDMIPAGKFSIAQFPFPIYTGIDMTWGFSGSEPSRWLYEKPTMSKFMVVRFVDQAIFYNLRDIIEESKLDELFRILNIKYVIVNKDIDYESRNMMSYEYVNDIFANNNEYKLYASIGNLTVYYLKDYFDRTIVIYENYSNSGNIFDEKTLLINNSISAQLSLPENYTYRKINPTKYVVEISNSTHPFLLFLPQSYHSGWQATVNGKKIDQHFLANNFANAWLINKTGSSEVIVEFAPQRYVYVGVILSILGFVCLLLRFK